MENKDDVILGIVFALMIVAITVIITNYDIKMRQLELQTQNNVIANEVRVNGR